MKKLVVLFLFLTRIIWSQTETTHDAWLFLNDKPQASSFLENPLSMLSKRALDRRLKKSIILDEKDVPIDATYYSIIKNTPQIVILGKSKWLNAIHVQGTEANLNQLVTNLSFVKNIEYADKRLNIKLKQKTKKLPQNHLHKLKNNVVDFNYGAAENQIKMLAGDYLHKQGLTGSNQIIAVIDAGFPNVDKLEGFKRIRDNNQILGGYNFADRNSNFYTRNSHGTLVLSTIAGYIKDQFVGTAPDAKFYLFITEIAESETVLEETLWVEAAERADSLGVDVLNTSLGYTTFDNSNHDYSYSDMDGKTTFISRGAEIASSRGMLVVNSAGNSGSSPWKYIGAPADATSVISVGAVDALKNIANFSSFGPSFDGRLKPEIVAQGLNTSLIGSTSGSVIAASGTSFSGPVMAGLLACLNGYESLSEQSETMNSNELLKMAVFKSSDRYLNPDNRFGYGIPNFEIALNNYTTSLSVKNTKTQQLNIYPNPVNNKLNISADFRNAIEEMKIQIFTLQGKNVYEQSLSTLKNIDVSFLSSGMYLLKVTSNRKQQVSKFIKN